jgi:uncharacterized protein
MKAEGHLTEHSANTDGPTGFASILTDDHIAALSNMGEDPTSGPGFTEAKRRALQRSLTAFVEDPLFPCVGAKSALARGTLEIIGAWSIASAWDDLRIHDALVKWSDTYNPDVPGFRSFAVVFSQPRDLSEAGFERALWDRLASLIAKDGWRGNDYDPRYSQDPGDPHFALSFGGRAYFAVGLHPRASRTARRMPYPTIVFNLHEQFERLREEQKYERMREVILARDEELDGEPNPNIARHGEISEARQYSGRAVGDDWECPYSPGEQK